MAPSLVGCQALPVWMLLAAVQRGLVMKGLVAESYRALRLVLPHCGWNQCPEGPRAVAHPLAGEARSWVSAGLLAGRAGSLSLAARPRDPRAHFRSVGGISS